MMTWQYYKCHRLGSCTAQDLQCLNRRCIESCERCATLGHRAPLMQAFCWNIVSVNLIYLNFSRSNPPLSFIFGYDIAGSFDFIYFLDRYWRRWLRPLAVKMICDCTDLITIMWDITIDLPKWNTDHFWTPLLSCPTLPIRDLLELADRT